MTREDAIKHLKELPFLSLKSNTDWAVEQDINNQVAVNMAIKALEIKPIGYRECADAMLKMWMDNVLTDGEYYRIMDKLNAKWSKMNEVTE